MKTHIIIILNILICASLSFAQEIEATLAGHATDDGFSVKDDLGATLFRARGDGNTGVGTSNPQEKLDVNGGLKIGTTSGTNAGTIRWTGTDFEGYNGSSWKSFTSLGDARFEYFSGFQLNSGQSYCEVAIEGANPGDGTLIIEAYRTNGNGSGSGGALGKQIWAISCEGSSSTFPATIVEYTGEYDEVSNDLITLAGEDGPIFRVRFSKKYTDENSGLLIVMYGAFIPSATTFTVTNH